MENTSIVDNDKKITIINDYLSRICIDNGEGDRFITYECRINLINNTRLQKELSDIMAKSLRELLKIKRTGTTKILVAGLGNRGMTADALGARVVDRLKVNDNKGRSLYAFTPSVKGLTGLETFDVVKGISDRIKPDVIIVTDTLASRKVGRICSAFQMSDSGLRPGSGVGNARIAIDRNTLNIPVIAIGVPLVVYAKTLAYDVLSEYLDNPKKYDLSNKVVSVIKSNLNYKASDLVVTPKDIDVIVDTAAEIISSTINKAVWSF